MKKTGRLILLLFVWLYIFGYSQATKGATDIKGIYKTYDDYLNNKPDDLYSQIININGYYYLVKKGDKPPALMSKKFREGAKSDAEADIWGYLDKDGFAWRFIKGSSKVGAEYRIMQAGKIWLYTTSSVEFVTDKKGKVSKVEIYDKNNSMLYIQDGPDGKFVPCTKENLMSMLADAPDIVAQVKEKATGNYKGEWFFLAGSWVKNFEEIMGYISEYNNKHK